MSAMLNSKPEYLKSLKTMPPLTGTSADVRIAAPIIKKLYDEKSLKSRVVRRAQAGIVKLETIDANKAEGEGEGKGADDDEGEDSPDSRCRSSWRRNQRVDYLDAELVHMVARAAFTLHLLEWLPMLLIRLMQLPQQSEPLPLQIISMMI